MADDVLKRLQRLEDQEAIRAVIERRFPEHGFYGEETGKSRADAEYLWIVDPIDGTKAFVREYPMTASGKVQRFALRERVLEALGVAAPER